MMSEVLLSSLVKEKALLLGFSHCGIAPAEPVDESYSQRYKAWLEEGMHADMHYLENYFEKRMNPCLLVPGTRSVVSVALNYFPDEVAEGIAWYAQGKDYHDLMRERLSQLMEQIGAQGRCFVDTAPVPERYWAWRCGLGWIGKHSQLVIPKAGSTFFLGELFIEQEVDVYDSPVQSKCGKCQKCIDACPTGAITLPASSVEPTCGQGVGNFNARLCLSYLTIENRGELPEWASERMEGSFYGCDRCLRACPHLHGTPTSEPLLKPSQELLDMTPEDWQSLTVEQYQKLFKGSAIKRAKYEGLMRNIQGIAKRSLQNDVIEGAKAKK